MVIGRSDAELTRIEELKARGALAATVELPGDLYRTIVAELEALQRERDELKELTSVICGHCCEPMAIPSRAVLQAALDAELNEDPK